MNVLKSCELSPHIIADASAIFEIIANAEAAVHGVQKEKLEFHKIGARDAIADVVGACTAISLLNVDLIFTTPIFVGGGSLETDHGRLPIPTPATAAILAKYHLMTRGGPVEPLNAWDMAQDFKTFLTQTFCVLRLVRAMRVCFKMMSKCSKLTWTT
jgi:uncharacterized protein (DUF111 family)